MLNGFQTVAPEAVSPSACPRNVNGAEPCGSALSPASRYSACSFASASVLARCCSFWFRYAAVTCPNVLPSELNTAADAGSSSSVMSQFLKTYCSCCSNFMPLSCCSACWFSSLSTRPGFPASSAATARSITSCSSGTISSCPSEPNGRGTIRAAVCSGLVSRSPWALVASSRFMISV